MAGETPQGLSLAVSSRTFRLPILYGLTDSRGERGLSASGAARILLDAGVRLIQVREKSEAVRRRLVSASEAVALVRARGGIAIVNDRSDLALLSGADGVHLGEDDLSAGEARSVLGPSAIIGVSTHSVESARRAFNSGPGERASHDAATYVALGPIFATFSKSTPFAPLGLRAIERVARGKAKPLVVIGGVTPRQVGDCLAAGADSIAMIAGLLDGDAVRNVVEAMQSARRAGFGGQV